MNKGIAMHSTVQSQRVWDPLVRIFHWSTVLLCSLNWFVLEEGDTAHRWVGYAVGMLLIIRLVWGWVGSYYARFGQWWPTPSRLRQYLQAMRARRHPYYLGHNPVGSLMVLALMLGLCGTALTGWMTTWDAFWGEDWLEELHGFFANGVLTLAGIHAAVVLLLDRLTRSDLLHAMVFGSKRVPPGIKVEDARP